MTSTRGAHGGYELARPPETIPMGDVLRALEGPIAPMLCASDDPEHAVLCDRSSRCTVNVLWVRVRDAVAGALDSMTLADLVPPRPAPDRRRARADRPRLTRSLTDTVTRPDEPTPTPTSTSSSAASASRPSPTPSTRSSRAST